MAFLFPKAAGVGGTAWELAKRHGPGALTGALLAGGEQEPGRLVPDPAGGFVIQEKKTRLPFARLLAGAAGGVAGAAALRAMLHRLGATSRFTEWGRNVAWGRRTPAEQELLQRYAPFVGQGRTGEIPEAAAALLGRQGREAELAAMIPSALIEGAGAGVAGGVLGRLARSRRAEEA